LLLFSATNGYGFSWNAKRQWCVSSDHGEHVTVAYSLANSYTYSGTNSDAHGYTSAYANAYRYSDAFAASADQTAD
jgi:hypothetical protein